MFERKQRDMLFEANLIRSISTIGIVVFHTLNTLDIHFGYKYNIFYLYPHGNCGDVFVAVFFILSGFLLHRKYSDKMNIVDFYKRRWLSIFPSFYLCWIVFYSIRVLIEKKSFLLGHDIYKFLLTLLGMDGFFYYKGMNYYLVGEWFLGAIIIMYLIFPVLIKIVKKHPVMLCFCITALWLWQINTDIFAINSYRNLISCLVSFYIGILIAKHYDTVLALQRNPFMVGIEIVFFFICRCFHISINTNFIMHVMGTILYLLLVTLAMILSKLYALEIMITWMASVSFGIYLVHHRIIYRIVPYVSKGDKYYDTTISLLVCLPLSILTGYIVSSMSNKIKKTLIK